MSRDEAELKAIAAEWRRSRRIYPIYRGICQRFELAAGPCPELESPVDSAEPESLAAVRRWLQQVDELIGVHQLRTFLQASSLSTKAGLHALIERYLRREDRGEVDRDKLDFLLAQYFAQCVPASLLHRDLSLQDVARVLQPVLGEEVAELPVWLEPLGLAVYRVKGFRRTADLLATTVLQDARRLKGSDPRHFETAALAGFAWFNFVVRRTLVRLIDDDFEAIRHGVRKLTGSGVTAIDGQRAQLSPAESLDRVLETAQQLKRPFLKDYSSAEPAFAQLAELRAAVDDALEQRGMAEAPDAPVAVSFDGPPQVRAEAKPKPPAVTAARPSFAARRAAASPAAGPVPAAQAAPAFARPTSATAPPVAPAPREAGGTPSSDARSAEPAAGHELVVSAQFAADLQATAARLAQHLRLDGTRSRSAGANIVLGNARLSLSSWEVTAFVSGLGAFSAVIQQGVALRVLLFQALQQARQGGPSDKLLAWSALAAAMKERLEECITDSREARNIEATVTLSGAAQRLAELLADAEQFLQTAQ